MITMQNSNNQYISFASWNIQGISSKNLNKVHDPVFLKEICKHDVIALQETHCAPSDHIVIPGYVVHQVSRPLSGRKAHGGIALIVKKELKEGIKFIDSQSQDRLWLCMKKKFFHIDEDVYISTMYISPYNST